MLTPHAHPPPSGRISINIVLKTSAKNLCSTNQQDINLDKSCQDIILSIMTQQTFGETVRKLREGNDMPLRKLAALLDIDQSTLSKIERNERKANHDLIDKISKIFKTDKKELHISFVSDKVVYELMDEESSIDILKVAEEKISYIIQTKKKPNGK